MRVKKPQTRMAGGTLAKPLKPRDKKTVKSPSTATKARPIPSSIKSVSSKKLTAKRSTSNSKAKDECENNEKKSKTVNKAESSAPDKTALMGSNSAKVTVNRKKPISEKKSTTPAINGEKKAAPIKDEKMIKASKELKNLDIQLCGYSSMVVARESTGSDSDTDRVIKASICENVKTKARAASATFNSSGNRSPSVNSPGPNHSKQCQNTTDKANKNETALKSSDDKSDSRNAKKETTKAKSSSKPKAAVKSVDDKEKYKKSINENKITEGDKNANKSQKVKSKAKHESATKSEAPVALTEKRIEIKTQVDESKSLIDTIAEAINEVVKQYKDSNGGEATGPKLDSVPKATKKDNKIAKTSKKKVLNEKKLDVLESALDLVKGSRDAIKTIAKKTKVKQKLANDNKIEDKIADQIKQSSEKVAEREPAAANTKPSKSEEPAKKSNDKANKSVSKSKAKPKPKQRSKTTGSEQTIAKGSKIIKIDLKSKKKIKSSATLKSAPLKSSALKSAAKQLQNKVTKEPKLCQDDVKKNDAPQSQTQPDEMSDDDNLSLNELKAQLSKTDAQKVTSDAKSSNASTKLLNASSSSTNKQKATKNNFKKPTASSTPSTPKKKLTNQKESGIATSATIKSDVYEFHDANFSGDDIPYVHKKKREKISQSSISTATTATSTANQETSGSNADAKKSGEKSKTLPPKKQIRHEVMKEVVKTPKIDSKQTTTSAKGDNRCATDSKTEQGENDQDDKISETKKSTKAHANNSHKLAAKNRRMKLFGFYSGPKRHRMASLNATAKVQCLYENESRTAQELGFVKEPQNVQRMKIVSDADKNEPHSAKTSAKEKEAAAEKKEKKPKKDGDDANVETKRNDIAVNNRTLRKVPGLRGEGTLWEMENSSMDESDTDKEEKSKTVSNIQIFFF